MSMCLLKVVCLLLLHGTVALAQVFSLGGAWTARSSNGSYSVTNAFVPGQIHLDLLRAGIIEEPLVGFNDVKYRWVDLENWTYERSFQVNINHEERALLVLEGVDTIASIFINGHFVANISNMFHRHFFDVTAFLETVPNNQTIRVSFTSAVQYALSQAALSAYPLPDGSDSIQNGERNRNFIRKMQSSFSWDWGPAFATQGIWAPIYLLPVHGTHITYVAPQISLADGCSPADLLTDRDCYWNIDATVTFWASKPLNGKIVLQLYASQDPIVAQADVTVSDFGEHSATVALSVSTKQVELWWPRGYGDAKLYNLSASISLDGRYNQEAPTVKTVGFRTVELLQEPYESQDGTSFYFRVNSVSIFLKGANFIPVDMFSARDTDGSRLTRLINSAVEANMNVLRNWGGGIYQVDMFYDLCDRLGMMVWEEFKFACALYPTDTHFLQSVETEIHQQMNRLMHHPSILLWSANNENQAALVDGWWQETKINTFAYAIDYDKLYHKTIKTVVDRLDSTRPFLSSSPTKGMLSEDPYTLRWLDSSDENFGDVHFYDYDMLCTNLSALPQPRLASEYGFQSFPSMRSLQTVSTEGDLLHPFTTFLTHRQHHANGTEQMIRQITKLFNIGQSATFKAPEDIGPLVYLSQCAQSVCVEAQTQHYRRLRSSAAQTGGALYWQLNDVWQAPTWSSIEYDGRWKMLHYTAKRFFAPVLVSAAVLDQTLLSVHVTNDLRTDFVGTLLMAIWRYDRSESLKTMELNCIAKTGASTVIVEHSIKDLFEPIECSFSTCLIQLTVRDNNQTVHSRNVYFSTSLRDVIVRPVTLTIELVHATSSSVTLSIHTSASVALFVWIQTVISGMFDDNGFHLFPNEPRSLTFRSVDIGDPEKFVQSLEIDCLNNIL